MNAESQDAPIGKTTQLLKPKGSTIQLLATATALILGPYAVSFPYYFSLTGPSLWLAFVVAVILILPIIFAYGELTAMLPFAGGEYVFARTATNRPIAFWIGWLLSLVYMITVSFMAAAVLRIILIFLDLPEPNRWVFALISIGIMLVFTIINVLNVKISFTIQVIACALLLVVGIATQLLFATSQHWSASNLTPFMPNGIGGFLGAVGVVASLYFGFDVIPQLSEESNYPARRQVWIMLGAALICGAFYVLASVANAGMMPWDWLSSQMADDPAIARLHWGSFVLYAVLIAALLATLTTLNGFILGASRLVFGLGRARVLPPSFGRINKHDVPAVAVWFTFLIAAAVLLIGGEGWVGLIIALASGVITAVYSVMCLCALILRTKQPGWKRPYKVKGGPVVFVTGFITGGALSVFALKELVGRGWWVLLGYVVVGIIYYIYMVARAKSSEDHREVELTPADIDAVHARLEQ